MIDEDRGAGADTAQRDRCRRRLTRVRGVAELEVGIERAIERLKRDALPLPVEYRDSMPQWSAANKGRRPVRLCVSEAIDVLRGLALVNGRTAAR